MRIWPGKPFPLGATWDGRGVNFALFSENAENVELCLFDSLTDQQEKACVPLIEHTDHVFHAYLPGIGPGQLYGYRVFGSYAPEDGSRFNQHKVLLDPYAKAIVRTDKFSPLLLDYQRGNNEDKLLPDLRDNAAIAPLGVVVDGSFSWGDDKPPSVPWAKTVIYEAHVKGLTMLHPEVPKHLRGTFLGVASPPIISHLKSLGVTAIELMPIHQKFDEPHLIEKGLTNYWGYNSLGFFAPDWRFGVVQDGCSQLREFKSMVRTLHAAGIEVILDVVYNHTAEGGFLGPTLSFRGIDNKSYYRLNRDKPADYIDFTGCGNTLNMLHPRVLQMIMDSLRYWVQEMHVDGFRFDLASALARELYDVDRLGAFFDIIHQDPVISQVKLIAEPWDLGNGGYQVGNFPILWTEWNGRYRDTMRSFCRGDKNILGEFATRLSGSSDLYGDERSPCASINYITCHDGFTLEDLVSYNNKHNDLNLEEGRDGTNDNRSCNYGHEGKTTDLTILALRAKQKRNLMTTLFFSCGVPMLSGGDENGRTQDGNNNAYCQDNPTSWYPWDNTDPRFLNFVRGLVQFRKSQAVLQRRRFFSGTKCSHTGLKDLTWFSFRGVEMTAADWHKSDRHSLGVLLSGDAIDELDEQGEQIRGDTLFLIFHLDQSSVEFILPKYPVSGRWALVIDTHSGEIFDAPKLYEPLTRAVLPSQTIHVYKFIPSTK